MEPVLAWPPIDSGPKIRRCEGRSVWTPVLVCASREVADYFDVLGVQRGNCRSWVVEEIDVDNRVGKGGEIGDGGGELDLPCRAGSRLPVAVV